MCAGITTETMEILRRNQENPEVQDMIQRVETNGFKTALGYHANTTVALEARKLAESLKEEIA